MERLDFVLLDSERLPPPLAGVSAALEVAPRQPGSAGAIALRLRLSNAGDAPVSLKNPYDLLTYSLSNGDGWPIGQVAPPSRIKTNGKGAERRLAYLAVAAVTVADAARDVAAEVAAATITIPPRASYAYDLRIETVVGPQGAAGPVTIVPGSYSLGCVLSLIAAVASDPAGAVLQTGKLAVVVE